MREVRRSLPELTTGFAGEVLTLLTQQGEGAWLVGGAVRDAALGRAATDVDIATTWTPEQVMTLSGQAGFKALPTGIDHGTVTLIQAQEAIEVTTLRRDVATDGRRAVVAFTRDLAEDAARRDFTINALYADHHGDLLDPLGKGLHDLAAGRVRFIGEASQRIAEDYLRILRFFRFSASHGLSGTALDPEGRRACAANVQGLMHVSAERIWSELKRILSLKDPSSAVLAMAETGVLAWLFDNPDAPRLKRFLALEGAGQCDTLARLAALVPEDQGVAEKLRLSRSEAKALHQFQTAMRDDMAPGEMGYRLKDHALTALLLCHAKAETKPADAALAMLRKGQLATFPLKAVDLPNHLTGPAIGQALRKAERDWIESGFSLKREALLARL